ncbi:hypothetical protein [Ekhidna sp.]|uniref:hypothetical protein n=1 Tax=Ekhidna sp. TaxID=2608089 RepID=UPI003CCBC2F9
MKISKKEYHDKQNQATGALIMSILALVMIVFHAYRVLVNGEPFEWERWIGWVIMFPGMFLGWRYRERILKKYSESE